MASLRDAMRKVAATVAVISTRHEGQPMAMTATSFCSVSMDPATILVCVNRSAAMHAALGIGSQFCMNLLCEGQVDVSAACGGQLQAQQKFRVGEWSNAGGDVPFLGNAQANIFCTVAQIMDSGTHSIIIGLVRHVEVMPEVAPLVYCDGNYVRVAAAAQA